METKICLNCGELVPQGCCTCGTRQELADGLRVETLEQQVERVEGFYWHVHHDTLLEWCYDYEERREYILAHKPPEERELRLILFQPVRGELPGELVRAWQEHNRAWRERNRAWRERNRTRQKRNRARQEHNRACQKYAAEIESLHQNECPGCPWDGTTIFPLE